MQIDVQIDVAAVVPTVVVAPSSTPRIVEPAEPANSLAPVATIEARPAAEVSPPTAPEGLVAPGSTALADEDPPFRPRRRNGVYVVVGSVVLAAGAWLALSASPPKRPHPATPAAAHAVVTSATAVAGPVVPATAAPAESSKGADAVDAAAVDAVAIDASAAVASAAESAAPPKAPDPPPKAARATDAGAVVPSGESAKDGTANPLTMASDAGTSDADADMVTVAFNIWPTGARVTYKGKEIGRSPFKMQIKRGERRAVEAVFPGYMPRRVVVDGSESEISFGMKAEESTTEAASTTPSARAEPATPAAP